MYQGEVNIPQEELNSFLAVAEDLKIRGLSGDETVKSANEKLQSPQNDFFDEENYVPPQKRKFPQKLDDIEFHKSFEADLKNEEINDDQNKVTENSHAKMESLDETNIKKQSDSEHFPVSIDN